MLWKRTPLPAENAKFFNYSQFCMELNEVLPEMEGFICPTDSRLRPDQRAYENGNIVRFLFFFFLFALVDSNIQEKATSEKLRLEEKQRKVRKEREAKGIEWTPRWFKQELDKDSGEMCWFFQGDYWDSRETGKYTDVADIF